MIFSTQTATQRHFHPLRAEVTKNTATSPLWYVNSTPMKSASRAWYSRRPARQQRAHSKRGTRSVPGPRSALGSHSRDSRRARSSRFVTIYHAMSRFGYFGWTIIKHKSLIGCPLKSRSRGTRIGTTAANRHLYCPVHPRPRALRPARALVCARPRVCARPQTTHYQARARRTRATRRHDAQ